MRLQPVLTSPIPLTILSGFLGAGKTTLLNRILNGDHGIRIAVLVNDFGAINIDAQLVVGVEGGQMINLANGCICCTIRGDLLRETLNLVERPDPPEYILVETSGVSDPVSVAQTFQLPELRDKLHLDGIITVMDAEQFGHLEGKNAYLAYEQLTVADIVVINKIDLVTPEALQRLRREWLYPTARILEAKYGDVPLELLLGVGHYSPERIAARKAHDVHVHEQGDQPEGAHEPPDHPDHADHSLVFESWHWQCSEPLSLKALQKATKGLPPTVFRAKGILWLEDMPDQQAILHLVGTRVTLTTGPKWGDQKPGSQLVIIGTPQGFKAEELTVRFEKCRASHQSRSIADLVLGSALTWFRGKDK